MVFDRCDRCGKLQVIRRLKHKLIKGVEMDLCNQCYQVIVKSVFIEYEAVTTEGERVIREMKEPKTTVQ
jgi:hypothetical protein